MPSISPRRARDERTPPRRRARACGTCRRPIRSAHTPRRRTARAGSRRRRGCRAPGRIFRRVRSPDAPKITSACGAVARASPLLHLVSAELLAGVPRSASSRTDRRRGSRSARTARRRSPAPEHRCERPRGRSNAPRRSPRRSPRIPSRPRILFQRLGREVQEPGTHDRAVAPDLGDLGQVEVGELRRTPAGAGTPRRKPGGGRTRSRCGPSSRSAPPRRDPRGRSRPPVPTRRGPARDVGSPRRLPPTMRQYPSASPQMPPETPASQKRIPRPWSSSARRIESRKFELPPSTTRSPFIEELREGADRLLGRIAGGHHRPDRPRALEPAASSSRDATSLVSGFRSYPMTSWSRQRRRSVMFAPIRPRPTMPIFIVARLRQPVDPRVFALKMVPPRGVSIGGRGRHLSGGRSRVGPTAPHPATVRHPVRASVGVAPLHRPTIDGEMVRKSSSTIRALQRLSHEFRAALDQDPAVPTLREPSDRFLHVDGPRRAQLDHFGRRGHVLTEIVRAPAES